MWDCGLFEDKMSENYSDYGISGWALDPRTIASHDSFDTKILGPSHSPLSHPSLEYLEIKGFVVECWWHLYAGFESSFPVHDAWKDGCFNELDHDRDGHPPSRLSCQPMRCLYSPALTNQRPLWSVIVRNLGLLAAVIIVHELILSDTDRNFLSDNIEL